MTGYGAGSIPQTQGYGGGGGDVASFLGGQDAQRQAMLNYMYKGNVSGGAWAGTQGSSGGGGSTTNNTTYNMSTPTTINNPAPQIPQQQQPPNTNLPDPSAQKPQQQPEAPKPKPQYWDQVIGDYKEIKYDNSGSVGNIGYGSGTVYGIGGSSGYGLGGASIPGYGGGGQLIGLGR